MKQLKDIKRKLEWEQYYNPEFNWSSVRFYVDNKLSEDFIREFQDKVDWEYLFVFQTLSEDFIREFKDNVSVKNCWKLIITYQTLSEDFEKEFKKELNIL